MKAMILTASLLLGLPAAGAPMLAELQPVGQGEMHWLWFKLYDATLYSPNGRYHKDARPLALSILYARDIEREDLLAATREEWQRLLQEPRDLQEKWLSQLAATWPDIQAGDRLTLYVDKEGHSQFWHGEHALGQLLPPDFAPAFLAIWLDERSRNPALTRQLRGESKP
ncbi:MULTISPECIES: chalcone isomerase family protein [Shewanella]|uniref:Chalcone isomerase family protein n=1 Tax=Shewanella sedimentimangrovi TaxID=2814293 RepID=A0ABX7QZK0_9GAMM|nr:MULTISPECIES: chalcone isomerase family protein [Shewanella]QSX36679.1 chalcone isomerase family protein [Shewanella sedimentimangrovi]QSX40288.1 chalcone isomerase family protein [Shewanella cyperi]